MPRIYGNMSTLTLIAVLAASSAHSQAVSIPLREAPEGDLYPWITELKAGPISWNGTPDSDVAGHFFRVMVTTTEVYNDVFVERLTVGEEGFDKKLLSRWMMDVEAMASAFAIRGEFAGLRLGEWEGPDVIVMSIGQRRYRVSISGEDHVLVEEIER